MKMNELLKVEFYSSPSIRTVTIRPHNICAASLSGTTHEGYGYEEIVIS